MNKWKLQNKFNFIHTVIKENESPLRLELLTLEIPSIECDIPKALRISFLQKWTQDPVNERLSIPHIILGNNYRQHHPKPLSMTEEQLTKFPVNKMYNSNLTGCIIFTGPLKFGDLKAGLDEYSTTDLLE